MKFYHVQTSLCSVVFFVSKFLLGIERQKKLKKNAILPESFWAMLEYWYIECGNNNNNNINDNSNSNDSDNDNDNDDNKNNDNSNNNNNNHEKL